MKKAIKIVCSLAVLIFIVFFYSHINPIDYQWVPKCPFYLLTGYKCPGCGTQRAIYALLHGDILNGLIYNPMLMPAIFYIVLIYATRKKPIGDKITGTIATRVILVIVILYWLFRNIFNF